MKTGIPLAAIFILAMTHVGNAKLGLERGAAQAAAVEAGMANATVVKLSYANHYLFPRQPGRGGARDERLHGRTALKRGPA
jgi:hypothetical protein